MHRYSILVFGAVWLLLAGCAGRRVSRMEKGQGQPVALPAEHLQPDYQQLGFWAAHPLLHDPSDSIPAPYRDGIRNADVDVFFVHPTTYTAADAVADKPYNTRWWNAHLQDAALNRTTDYSTILNQASVFNAFAVYAPRYRQAHIRSFYLPDSISRPFFDTAYADVLAAFDYFLQQHNRGRPFILASHSQGTVHATRLLTERITGTPLQDRLVAAYLIGMAVPESLISPIPSCQKPGQTGCAVGWRTWRRGHGPSEPEGQRMLVINPLSFDAAIPASPRSSSRGAVLYKFNQARRQNVATEVHGNILWSSKPRFFGNIFFTRKNYHIGDINLFWRDVRENALLRASAFRQLKP